MYASQLYILKHDYAIKTIKFIAFKNQNVSFFLIKKKRKTSIVKYLNNINNNSIGVHYLYEYFLKNICPIVASNYKYSLWRGFYIKSTFYRNDFDKYHATAWTVWVMSLLTNEVILVPHTGQGRIILKYLYGFTPQCFYILKISTPRRQIFLGNYYTPGCI